MPELNPFRIVAGRPPTQSNEIVIDKQSSDDGDLAVGDRTSVITQQGPNSFTIVGIAKFGTADSPGGASFALMTLQAVRSSTCPSPARSTPSLSLRIQVSRRRSSFNASNENCHQEPKRSRATQITKENQDDIQEGISMFFNFLIRPFAVVAILVSVFSIYNTFSIIVTQRTREMALLRALGAARRQVLMSVIGEAFVIGVVASVVGLFVGLGVAILAEGVARSYRFRRAVGRSGAQGEHRVVWRSRSASASQCSRRSSRP